MADSSGSANSANVTAIGNSLEEALGERLISAGRIDAIADFRDKDDLERLNGAEDSAYSAAGRDYGPKNARFETVDELRRVLGVTPDIYRPLAPLVTVHSGRRGINPVTAPHALLLALPPPWRHPPFAAHAGSGRRADGGEHRPPGAVGAHRQRQTRAHRQPVEILGQRWGAAPPSAACWRPRRC